MVRTGVKSVEVPVLCDPVRFIVFFLEDVDVSEEGFTVRAGLYPISFPEPDLDPVNLVPRERRTEEPSRLNGLGLKRLP